MNDPHQLLDLIRAYPRSAVLIIGLVGGSIFISFLAAVTRIMRRNDRLRSKVFPQLTDLTDAEFRNAKLHELDRRSL